MPGRALQVRRSWLILVAFGSLEAFEQLDQIIRKSRSPEGTDGRLLYQPGLMICALTKGSQPGAAAAQVHLAVSGVNLSQLAGAPDIQWILQCTGHPPTQTTRTCPAQNVNIAGVQKSCPGALRVKTKGRQSSDTSQPETSLHLLLYSL